METTSKRKSGTTDLTVGKPLFQILRFALPLVLGTLFQQLYSFADTVIVGRCLGTDALGAVGTTYSLNFLILGFVQGACVGFGIPVAETFGAKDQGGLRKYLFNGALLCVVLSVVFTLFTTLMAGPLLQLIHTPEELYADAVLYIRIIFLGIPATVLYNYASSVLRAMGDSQHPFYFLLAASVLNIGLGLPAHRLHGHGRGRRGPCHRPQPAAQRRAVRVLVLYPDGQAGGAHVPGSEQPALRRAL